MVLFLFKGDGFAPRNHDVDLRIVLIGHRRIIGAMFISQVDGFVPRSRNVDFRIVRSSRPPWCAFSVQSRQISRALCIHFRRQNNAIMAKLDKFVPAPSTFTKLCIAPAVDFSAANEPGRVLIRESRRCPRDTYPSHISLRILVYED